jgi:hypothetical protein
MSTRFLKLSARSRALLAGGIMLGVALAPVAAQQVGSIDGQLALRSDGALYLLANGQRRLVATVQISDDELNAYPEADPVYAGVAPLGPQTAAAPRPSSSPAASSPAGTAPSAGSTTSSGTTAAAPAAVETPTGATGQVDPSLPIEVDITGTPKFQPGERIVLDVKTTAGASCELAVKWPDGNEVDQEKKTADSRGRCHYSIPVASTAAAGTGSLKGIVRKGGVMSRQDVQFDIIPQS